MTELNQDITIAKMQKDIEYIKESIDKLTSSIESHIENCEGRYASKWVEKATGILMFSIVTAVIASILKLVIR